MTQSRSIVLGGGCFWCLEASYQLLAGVTSVAPGYAGGTSTDPSYEQVLSGATGHAEVVRVQYDPARLELSTILAVFWTIHDATSLNRQGADVGSQYSSVILYETDDDLTVVKESLSEAQSHLSDPIVTRIEPLKTFYEAEDYHHNYFLNNPEAGYCRAVIDPKLTKLRKHFAPLLNV